VGVSIARTEDDEPEDDGGKQRCVRPAQTNRHDRVLPDNNAD